MLLPKAQVRLTGSRDWELKLSTPSWRPDLRTVSAPAVAAAPAVAVPVPAKGRKAREQAPAPVVVPASHSTASVEVFVDLSMFGIFEGEAEQPKVR